MKPCILLIDSDPALTEYLSSILAKEGYQTDTAHDGQQGLTLSQKKAYQAIVLDIVLPNLNGFEIIQKVRTQSATPILVLSACSDDVDKILALDLGASDYIKKPCPALEFVTRLRKLITHRHTINNMQSKIQYGQVTINRSERTVQVAGKQQDLTNTEFNILDLFIQSPGKAFSKEELTQYALGRQYTAYDRSIDVHISNLRHKLNGYIKIKTVRSFGYLLEP